MRQFIETKAKLQGNFVRFMLHWHFATGRFLYVQNTIAVVCKVRLSGIHVSKALDQVERSSTWLVMSTI